MPGLAIVILLLLPEQCALSRNWEEIIMRKQYEGRLYEIWLSKDERYQLKQMQLGLLITGTEVFDNKIFKDIMYMFFKDIADEKTFKEAEMYLL